MILHMNIPWCYYYVLITVLSFIIDNIKTDFIIYFFFLNLFIPANTRNCCYTSLHTFDNIIIIPSSPKPVAAII